MQIHPPTSILVYILFHEGFLVFVLKRFGDPAHRQVIFQTIDQEYVGA